MDRIPMSISNSLKSPVITAAKSVNIDNDKGEPEEQGKLV